ncbi:uncharacterized protein N7484_000339 [Penicillium longicatenatum]|uniref:uncharacterized protein n=1 Tax=Penicillium longicatenatum TaxID=1561947 RepID=UPI002547E774|nr:uncharacterized protein N7484_000339 [Penicillium longicatenatum]KAJ5660967.1 hypothetical protein N7484_000339 [Penicillium longicatenatum]
MSSPGLQTQTIITTDLLVVAIVLPILSTVAVLLRLWSNLAKLKRLFLDDYVIILAQLCVWGMSINVYVGATLGGVNQIKGTALSAATVSLRTLYIQGILLTASLTVITVWVYIGGLLAWGVAIIIVRLLCTNPISQIWDPKSVTPLRYDVGKFSIAFAAMSLFFDLLVLCIPIPLIHHLQMSTRKKLKVLGIFWLGIFCCFSSAIRLYYIPGLSQLKWSPAFIWALIEPNASVIAACLPIFGHLLGEGWRISTFVQNFWARLRKRHIGSGKIGASSNGISSTAESNANPPFAEAQSDNRHQLQGFEINKTTSVDVELGDHAYDDAYPLVAYPQQPSLQMKIHVASCFR